MDEQKISKQEQEQEEDNTFLYLFLAFITLCIILILLVWKPYKSSSSTTSSSASSSPQSSSLWGKTTYIRAKRIPDLKPCSDFSSKYKEKDGNCAAEAYTRKTYTLFDKSKCPSENPQGCQDEGLFTYPKCEQGFKGMAFMCHPDGGPGVKVEKNKRLSCKPEEELINEMCYTLPKQGYTCNAENCTN